MPYLVQAMGKRDPAGALALARKGTGADEYEFDRPYALALAAQFQAKAPALQALKEAADTMAGEYDFTDLARIARMAYQLDPRSGMALYQRAKRLHNTNSDLLPGQSVAEYAYYCSALDPAESRILLETEFAARLQALKAPSSEDYKLSDLALAMTALDVNRALAMARIIPLPFVRQDALHNIAEYVLAPYAIRNEMPFQCWARESPETWTPSQAIGW